MIWRLALVVACWWGVASAQGFPEPLSPYINDFADVLSSDSEARIEPILQELRDEDGVEATLVTFNTRAGVAPGLDLEAFATALFNQWGIGDAARNDGVLLLYLHEDREVRVELGAAYGRDWDYWAGIVADDVLVPNFRAGRTEVGLEKGVEAIRDEVVRPFRAGEDPPKKAPGAGQSLVPFVIFAVVAFALTRAGAIRRRLRVCPNCGARGTVEVREDVDRLTHANNFETGVKYTRCTNCDYSDEENFSRPRRRYRSSRFGRGGIGGGSGSSGGSFGGGRSGGGGSSGRW